MYRFIPNKRGLCSPPAAPKKSFVLHILPLAPAAKMSNSSPNLKSDLLPLAYSL